MSQDERPILPFSPAPSPPAGCIQSFRFPIPPSDVTRTLRIEVGPAAAGGWVLDIAGDYALRLFLGPE